MISTACYPYPVNDTSSTAARRAPFQPHIYSPSEVHHSPRNAMYPHLHPSGSPSPNYIYSSYEQYYSKDGWASATPGAWSTLYPHPRASHPEAAVNPKVTIFPSQPPLVSDIDTPSSISSHTVLTPPSPFVRHDVGDMDVQSMDPFDDFDCDDDEDYLDSDFADEMEGIDETVQEHSLVYGASAPHVIKSTSALEGALGDAPSSSYHADLGVFAADRKHSASVPGYPSASRRATASHPPRSPPEEYPPAHAYTHHQHQHHQHHRSDYASSPSTTAHASSPSPSPSLSSLYTPSASSLAGAFASPHHHHHHHHHHHLHPASSSSPSRTLPILQPQPIRPIPPIPLAELASGAAAESATACVRRPLRVLSPLPLLCQPVSDTIRYQLKEPPSTTTGGGGALEGTCCQEEDDTSVPMCDDLVTTASASATAPTENRFARQGLGFCQEHAPSSVGERVYNACGNGVDLPPATRWR